MISLGRDIFPPRDDIKDCLETSGYCHLIGDSADRDVLRDLANLFGRIQCHERSAADGLVNVTSDPALQIQLSAEFKGLGTGTFGPHTDGAYLNAIYTGAGGDFHHLCSPALLILQCVQQARIGGDSVLIDGEAVFNKLVREAPDLYAVLCAPIFQFVRPSKSVFPVRMPIFKRLANGRYSIRFRDQYVITPDYEGDFTEVNEALATFYEDFLLHPDCKVTLRLDPGELLIIDNFRMLHGRSKFEIVGDHHRFLRRAWVVDEQHLMRLDGNQNWDIAVEQGDLVEFRARALLHDSEEVKAYSALQHPNGCSSLVQPKLGIRTDQS